MDSSKDDVNLKLTHDVKCSEANCNPDRIVFTQISKSELEKRRVSVYQYIL